MHVTIQSFDRSENVSSMHESLYPLKPTWYVPESQADDYENQGATVYPVKDRPFPMKPHQLNAALDHGFTRGEMVVCMDDDFKICKNRENETVPLAHFIDDLVGLVEKSRFFLGGTTNSSNVLWISGKVREHGNIPGIITVHKPNKLRYDPNLKLLEDLDMVIQHHIEHGGLIRSERFAAQWTMLDAKKKTHTQKGGYGLSRLKNHSITLKQMQEKYNTPVIQFPLDSAPGENVHGQIQWTKFVRAENTLDAFF